MSAQAVMKEALESDIINNECILKCIHGRCKNKDKVLDVIKNSRIKSNQRFKMNESMDHMKQLQDHINNCEVEKVKRVALMLDQFIHIAEMPGIMIYQPFL